MNGPRFDRIVPLITLVLLGLGVVFLLELNTEQLVVDLGESLPSFSIGWALVAVLALVTGIGVELVTRAQPRLHSSGWMSTLSLGQREIELALPLWSVPMLTPVAVFAFFRLFEETLATTAYLLVLVATGVLLTAVLIAQHYLIAGEPEARERARQVQSALAYALAFAIFSAVTFNRYRTLYAIALVYPSTLLLAADLLRGRVVALWTLASVIALVLIEGYWALSFWPAPFWYISVALLVILYVLVGLAQASYGAASDRRLPNVGLSRGAMLEYGLLGVGVLVALVIATEIARQQNIELRSP